MRARTKYVLAIVLAAGTLASGALAQEKPIASAKAELAAYDINHETNLIGTVLAYTPTTQTPPLGAHVTLQTSAGVVDVHLGNARLLTANHFTIQNGDIDGFGYGGILFDASDKMKEHNFKNEACNVRFNNDMIGVLTISGSLVDVEECFFEGGSIGIYDIATLGGDRFQADNFEAQTGVEALNEGIGIVTTGGVGVLVEDCMVADAQSFGVYLNDGKGDKYRFNSFINDPVTIVGGIEEGTSDL